MDVEIIEDIKPEVIVISDEDKPSICPKIEEQAKTEEKKRKVNTEFKDFETLMVTQNVHVKQPKFRCIINVTSLPENEEKHTLQSKKVKYDSRKKKHSNRKYHGVSESRRHKKLNARKSSRKDSIVPRCSRKRCEDLIWNKLRDISHAKKEKYRKIKPKTYEAAEMSPISSYHENDIMLSYEDISSGSLSDDDETLYDVDHLIKRAKKRDRKQTRKAWKMSSKEQQTQATQTDMDLETISVKDNSSESDDQSQATTITVLLKDETGNRSAITPAYSLISSPNSNASTYHLDTDNKAVSSMVYSDMQECKSGDSECVKYLQQPYIQNDNFSNNKANIMFQETQSYPLSEYSPNTISNMNLGMSSLPLNSELNFMPYYNNVPPTMYPQENPEYFNWIDTQQNAGVNTGNFMPFNQNEKPYCLSENLPYNACTEPQFCSQNYQISKYKSVKSQNILNLIYPTLKSETIAFNNNQSYTKVKYESMSKEIVPQTIIKHEFIPKYDNFDGV